MEVGTATRMKCTECTSLMLYDGIWTIDDVSMHIYSCSGAKKDLCPVIVTGSAPHDDGTFSNCRHLTSSEIDKLNCQQQRRLVTTSGMTYRLPKVIVPRNLPLVAVYERQWPDGSVDIGYDTKSREFVNARTGAVLAELHESCDHLRFAAGGVVIGPKEQIEKLRKMQEEWPTLMGPEFLSHDGYPSLLPPTD